MSIVTTADIQAHATGNTDACTACHGTGQDLDLTDKPCWLCEGPGNTDCGLCGGRGTVQAPASGIFDGANLRRCPAALEAERRAEAAEPAVVVNWADFDIDTEGRITVHRPARCAICGGIGCPCQTLPFGSDEWYEAVRKALGTDGPRA